VQSARELGLRVEDAQLDRAVARMAEENGLTVSAFRDRLESDGMTFDRFRSDMRDSILMTRLREREVDARIEIAETEIDAQVRASRNARVPELKIAQILIGVSENIGAEQIERLRLRAEDIARQARSGVDFSRLAATFSDATGALETGGSLGWRTADRWPSLFTDALLGKPAGSVAGPLRSGAGFHVIRLEEERSAATEAARAVVQTRARHILVRPGTSPAGDLEAQRLLNDLRERVVARRSEFADLARQYSADGSAARGGDLGWLDPGDTVPEFDQVMQALPLNEISQPVRSPFGWHLIVVNERRNGSVADRERIAARNVIRERKIEEQAQEWLRRLRDKTFVELRLD
jgi:peptidyl-prolyl cis-trans isomerase SurA